MKELEESAKLMRHLLGSIDLSDIEDLKKVKLNDGENAGRASDADVFYRKHFDKKSKLMLEKQMEKIVKEATDEFKLQFGRGVFAGICLTREWFEKQTAISRSQGDKDKELELDEL